jgi:hypothetical protein
VRQLIDIQLDRLLHDEQRVLEVAGLIGLEVPTALVAATLELPIERVDELCDGLARRGLFLRHAGTEDWPDGSLQSRYGFTHGLVQEVCIERTSAARRQRIAWSPSTSSARTVTARPRSHRRSRATTIKAAISPGPFTFTPWPPGAWRSGSRTPMRWSRTAARLL